MILPKTEDDIRKMKKAGKIVAEFFEKIETLIKPGVSAKKIDELGFEIAKKRGGVPSFYKYKGYPASVCVSVDQEVIHGIPYHDKILEEGSIVSVDYGVSYDGFHADAAKTYIVGNGDSLKKKLVEICERALYESIKFLKPGMKTGDLGYFIYTFVRKNGFSVIRDFCGHGIGKQIHEDPPIPNYGEQGKGITLMQNMTICIEPMICAGSGDVIIQKDNWTVITADGSLSAHFEHTIRIRDGENEILTM